MTSPSETFFTTTLVLAVKDNNNGEFTIDAVEADPPPTAPDLHDGNRKELKLTTPVPGLKLVGYYDPDTKEVGLYVTFLGGQIGSKFSASIQTGLTVKIKTSLLRGTLQIYKKDNQLRFKFDLTVGWGILSKHFAGDVHLFNI